MNDAMEQKMEAAWDKLYEHFDVPPMHPSFAYGFKTAHDLLMPLLIEAMPHVMGSHGAEHMLDGFRPRRRPIDDLVERLKEVMDGTGRAVAICADVGLRPKEKTKMTLQQKILAALANSTSRAPVSTAQVRAAVGVKQAALTELEELLGRQKVGHCRIIKGGETGDLWWLAGNVESKLLPQTAARNRKTIAAKARAAKK